MIKIKFEVEEQETELLPIESQNVGSTSEDILNKKPPENLVAAEVPVANSVAVGSRLIKTEPVESSSTLSLTTQLNNSLNIQSLLRQNRIQNGWTTNEQSIPIGTQQQQQQSLLPKIEPIVEENHPEVPSLLDLSSSIPNFEETTTNCDTTEVPLLDQSSSILNPTSMEAFSCDITTEMFSAGPRAGFGRRAKLNVCYSVPITPKKPKPVPKRRKKVSEPSSPPSADNLESTSNDNGGCGHSEQDSGSGSISGPNSSSFSTTKSATAALSPPEAVPLLIGKKPLLWVPPLTLEERKASQRERSFRSYHRHKANPKPVDPEIMAEKRRRIMEYNQKYRQQRLASATPEQLEQRLERARQYARTVGKQKREQFLASVTPEQREQRREKNRQYARTVGKQKREQFLANATPEQREQRRLKNAEWFRRHREKETEEQHERRLEQKRQYGRTVRKQRNEQKLQSMTPEEREKKSAIQREIESQTSNSSSMNLVVDNSESSTSLTSNHPNHSSLPTNDNNGIVDIGKTISNRKNRKPRKKRFELSMDDSDIDVGGEEPNSQTILESPKPGPSIEVTSTHKVPEQC